MPQFNGGAFQVAPYITAFDQNFHNAYQHRANLQVQQTLGRDFQLTLGYHFASLRHGLYYTDTNLQATGQVLADRRPVFAGMKTRPNPSFGAINLLRSRTSITGCTASVVNTENSSNFLQQTYARTARNVQLGSA